jgi:hypothetical protein
MNLLVSSTKSIFLLRTAELFRETSGVVADWIELIKDDKQHGEVLRVLE